MIELIKTIRFITTLTGEKIKIKKVIELNEPITHIRRTLTGFVWIKAIRKIKPSTILKILKYPSQKTRLRVTSEAASKEKVAHLILFNASVLALENDRDNRMILRIKETPSIIIADG